MPLRKLPRRYSGSNIGSGPGCSHRTKTGSGGGESQQLYTGRREQRCGQPNQNPAQSDQNFPFSAGQKMHEVAQYQNFFTFPLDTYYNIFDAIYYFSDEKNRNRYTYDQQQLIISRIVRAAMDFGIPIEGIREKLMI